MNKPLLYVVVFVVTAILLSSCGGIPSLPPEPEEPREFKNYCEEMYAIFLTVDPGLPRSFVGYCIQTLHTGDETLGLQRFCGYMVELGDFSTIAECIQDVQNAE